MQEMFEALILASSCTMNVKSCSLMVLYILLCLVSTRLDLADNAWLLSYSSIQLTLAHGSIRPAMTSEGPIQIATPHLFDRMSHPTGPSGALLS